MRKIKRMIALVTVAMFLLSLAPVGALAATKEDAFYRLNGLGVAFGDQNGDPMFDKNYTRAEAAALMVQLSGMGAAIDAAKGATKFSDVPASHWASGVINLAVGSGIIKGYPNGTYKPEAPVTYAEMCAMLIQVLGYGPKLQGTWPANVIGKAAELNLLDGVSVSSYNSPAIRGMVFIAADNALDTNILEEDKDGYTEGGTLIDEKFDSKIYDEADYLVKAWEVDADGQFELTLNGDDPFTEATTVVDFDITLAEKAVVEGGTSPSLLTNQLVNFVWNDEDDEATYVRVVSTKIKSDDVAKDGDKLKVNGTSYKTASGTIEDLGYAPEAAGVYNDFYNVYLNDDDKIYRLERNVAGSPKMVDELKTDKTLKYMDSGSVDLDQDEVLVIKDGKVAKVEDLKQTDIVYVTEDDFGLDVYVDAYSLKNEGKFEAAMETVGADTFDQVKIGGKKFDIAADLKISSDNGDTWTNLSASVDLFDDLYDETVKFGLNKAGDVSFIITDAKADSNSIYAIVNDADTSSKGLVTQLSVMTSEGKEVSYDVDTNEIELDYNNDATSYTGEDLLVADDDFVKITLDANGKISDVDAVTDLKNLVDAVEDLNKIKAGTIWYYTTSNTKVINANGTDDAEVVAAADLLDYLENTADVNDAYVKLDGSNVEFVLIDTVAITATAEDKALILDKYYRDGKYYATMDIRGTETTYELAGGSTEYAAIADEELYEYSMDGSKVDIAQANPVNIDVNFDVYGEITDINADAKAIEISTDKANLSVDEDTYIYDMTGDDPEYVSDFDTLTEGDYVFAIEVTGDDDRKGVADVIFIVDDEDYAGKNFETGYVVTP